MGLLPGETFKIQVVTENRGQPDFLFPLVGFGEGNMVMNSAHPSLATVGSATESRLQNIGTGVAMKKEGEGGRVGEELRKERKGRQEKKKGEVEEGEGRVGV